MQYQVVHFLAPLLAGSLWGYTSLHQHARHDTTYWNDDLTWRELYWKIFDIFVKGQLSPTNIFPLTFMPIPIKVETLVLELDPFNQQVNHLFFSLFFPWWISIALFSLPVCLHLDWWRNLLSAGQRNESFTQLNRKIFLFMKKLNCRGSIA